MDINCTKCGSLIRADNRRSKSRWCKECHKEYDRARYAQNADSRKAAIKAQRISVQEFVDEIKRTSPCTDCGGYFHPAVMEYDHLPGSKKTETPSNLARTGRKNRFNEEIKGCELVCANCHRMRTVLRRRKR